MPFIEHPLHYKIVKTEQISGCQQLRGGEEWREMAIPMKGESEGSPWRNCSTSTVVVVVVTPNYTHNKIAHKTYIHTPTYHVKLVKSERWWIISMSISCVWNYRRCYHWGKWVKGTWGLSVLVLRTVCIYSLKISFLESLRINVLKMQNIIKNC